MDRLNNGWISINIWIQKTFMLEKIKQIPEEWFNFVVKVLLASLLAISIKLAAQMKKEKITLMSAFLSIIIGVGTAALCGGLILHVFSSYWVPVASGVVTIIGEKIANYMIYTFKVDKLMEDLLKYLTRKK